MILKTDVTDWANEAKASAVHIKTKDDIITLMSETKMKPLQIARLAIVLREWGKADKDILPTNKISLQLGAAQAISQQVTGAKARVTIKGKEHSIPRWTATVTIDETGAEPEYRTLNAETPRIDSSVTLVEYSDKAAQARCIQYLMTNIVGHIRSRLAIIAAGKGNVKSVAEALKAEIDRIVGEFV